MPYVTCNEVCTMLPYDYTPAVLYAMDLLSQGHSLTVACEKSNISVRVYNTYVKRSEELQELHNEAMVLRNDALTDVLLNIDNDKVHGRTDAKMAKVISDNIKWALEKNDPRRFGQRVEIKHELTLDRAIIAALDAAKDRIPALTDGTGVMIDLTPVDDDISELLR